jgi:hypothetical protein
MMSALDYLCAVALPAMVVAALPQTADAADATIKRGNTAPYGGSCAGTTSIASPASRLY